MFDIGGIFATPRLDTRDFKNDIERAKAALDVLDGQIEKLRAALRSGEIGMKSFADTFNGLSQMRSTGGGALEAVAVHAGKASAQMRQMAWAVDDLQYVGEMGLKPIINNVMM